MDYITKDLKPYKGFAIEKSWKADEFGRPIKSTLCYTAYGLGDNGLYDADITLAGLKKKVDIYLNGAKSLGEIINR